MINRLGIWAVYLVTLAITGFYPQPHAPAPGGDRPRVEMVFVLDTTGSMGGLLDAARQKIWSIATTLASARPTPEIRLGLVAYRDRGDEYVTRVIDLSRNLDQVYAALMDLQAAGGGDRPESVHQALYEAVHHISWSDSPASYRSIFLVGDAPGHTRHAALASYRDIVQAALHKDIVVNTIQAGQHPATRNQWQSIAAAGQGTFLRVDHSGNPVAIGTPYDRPMAELSRSMDETWLGYSESAEARAVDSARFHQSASLSSRARRAAFMAKPGTETNWLGDGDLLRDLDSGAVRLDDIPEAGLPPALRQLTEAQRQQKLSALSSHRAQLKRQLAQLSQQRDAYLASRLAATGGDAGSLDRKLFEAVQTQALEKGIRYESGPSY